MNRNSLIIILLVFGSLQLFSQTAQPDLPVYAGPDRIINWEESPSALLEGSINVKKTRTEWNCVNNNEVTYKDRHDLVTLVTFPRPGYYLLKLSAMDKGKEIFSDEVIINVFKPNSFEDRLNDLIGLMTLEEKINQLTNESDSIPRLGLSKYNYWSEALHGVLDQGVTSFPQAIAMGSTWDPDLLRKVATAISDEARIKNAVYGKGLSYWSPTVNIARDPRWGRNEECYSEDPYLLSRMGVAFVKGMQGDDPYYLKTVATPKHFIANNEEIRRHSGSSDVDMRSLWEYYMPAFEATVTEGKAYSVMGAYNEVNQVPVCGNYYLLTDVLRNRWGFKGYVVSDCGAIHDMVAGHHFFSTGAEAAARGILAGCDLNCGSSYRQDLPEAIELGLIDEHDLDRALRRVLSARFRLGEFDPPEAVPYTDIDPDKLDGAEHRELALEAARKAIVLLKNDGVLPIDREKIKSIAVIGPNAAECQLGIYSGFPNRMVSPLEGIENAAAESEITIRYARGSELGGGLLKPIETKYFTRQESNGQKGLKGEYFNNMQLQGEPVLTRIDTLIDFNFGGKAPAPGLPEDQFSIRWTGKIIPPESRAYILGTRTDDGARLFLDGKLIIEDWTEHGEKPNTVKIDLEAGKEYDVVFEHYDNSLGAVARLTWDLGEHDFDAARRVAEKSDLVIMVLGTSPGISEEEHDRTAIELPEIQQELIREVAKVNRNIVMVLINGGPLALEGTEDLASAIVEAWFTGQSEGEAIADVLFGKVNPGGKLPQTFYASTNQLPAFSDYNIFVHDR